MLQLTWGWQPALYLFLGGMGAGAFIMAAVLYLIDKTRHSLTICVSMWAALLSLAVGLLLLVSELIQPMRGMVMWQAFGHFTSWMTYGAWGAFGACVVFGLSAVLATGPISKWLASKWKWYAEKGDGLRRVLAIIGIVLGAFVAVYTGMLLMSAGGVPLWNTALLPCLFTVSALDTGVALVEVVSICASKKEAVAHKASSLMERIVVCLVILECAVLAIYLGTMLGAGGTDTMGQVAAQSAGMLTSGLLAPYFWGMVVVCGLALPLIAAIVGLAAKGKNMRPVMFVGAAGALIGGCELRFLILAAGVHADLVSAAVAPFL